MKKLIVFFALSVFVLSGIFAFPGLKKKVKNNTEDSGIIYSGDESPLLSEDDFYLPRYKYSSTNMARERFGEISYVLPEKGFSYVYKTMKTPDEYYDYIQLNSYKLADLYSDRDSIPRLIENIKNCDFPLSEWELWTHSARTYSYKIDEKHNLEFKFSFPVMDEMPADNNRFKYGGEFSIIFMGEKYIYEFKIRPDFALKDFADSLSEYIRYREKRCETDYEWWWIPDHRIKMRDLANNFMEYDSSLPAGFLEFHKNFDLFISSIQFEE